MRLPENDEEQKGMTPTVISTLVAVTLFVGAILVVVLMMNYDKSVKHKPSAVQTKASQKDVIVQKTQHTQSDSLLSGNTLSPEDFDFWDMYPEKEEESQEKESESSKESTMETIENDPSTDGKHTLIKHSDGEEEWVLISPYLPKQDYDFTRLVCQSNLMKYYVDGKQVSYVGADISKYQDYVDFVKLKKAGVNYVMLRVGARGYGSGQIVLDEYFADNIKRATDAGLEIGVYFFSQAISVEEAVEEANLVLQSIGEYKITYPIAFDMEYIENDKARIEDLSKADKTTITKAFLDTIKNAGYTPMIYGNKEWLIKQIDMSKLTAYDVWLSQQEDVPDYPYQFTMWQYTKSANIDGIAGYANLNISFIDYSEK